MAFGFFAGGGFFSGTVLFAVIMAVGYFVLRQRYSTFFRAAVPKATVRAFQPKGFIAVGQTIFIPREIDRTRHA